MEPAWGLEFWSILLFHHREGKRVRHGEAFQTQQILARLEYSPVLLAAFPEFDNEEL